MCASTFNLCPSIDMCRYGGIFEKGSKEYTLDDFHSLSLDKLDRFTCLKESGVQIHEGDEESSEDDDDDDDDDDSEAEDDDSEDDYEREGTLVNSPKSSETEVVEIEQDQEEIVEEIEETVSQAFKG